MTMQLNIVELFFVNSHRNLKVLYAGFAFGD